MRVDVKPDASVAYPTAVPTVTGTTPRPGGEIAVKWLKSTTVTDDAGTPPNDTVVAPLTELRRP